MMLIFQSLIWADCQIVYCTENGWLLFYLCNITTVWHSRFRTLAFVSLGIILSCNWEACWKRSVYHSNSLRLSSTGSVGIAATIYKQIVLGLSLIIFVVAWVFSDRLYSRGCGRTLDGFVFEKWKNVHVSFIPKRFWMELSVWGQVCFSHLKETWYFHVIFSF